MAGVAPGPAEADGFGVPMLSVAAGDRPALGSAAPDARGDDEGSPAQLVVFASKMHATPCASRSYRATATWTPLMTRRTASRPAAETGARPRRVVPIVVSAVPSSRLRKFATRHASMAATMR